MVGSKINLFFSSDVSDVRGEQFANAMRDPQTFKEFVQAKNFTPLFNANIQGLRNYDVHPAIVQYVIGVGWYHKNALGTKTSIKRMLDDETNIGHNICKNVITKYDELTSEEKKFFDMYVNIVNSQSNIHKKIGDIKSSDDLDYWRVNLLKAQVSSAPNLYSPANLFYNDLLALGISVNNSSSLIGTGASMTLPTGLANIYYSAYEGAVTIGNNQLLSSPTTGFSSDLSTFLNDKLSYHEPATNMNEGAELPDSTLLDFTTGDIIHIQNGQFVRDGKSADFTNDKCYSTQLNVTAEGCDSLIHELILDGDSIKLNEFFAMFNGKDFAFQVKVEKEIRNIDPRIAVKILRRFGFKEYDAPTTGRSIKKFEHVDAWVAGLGQNVTQGTLAAINASHHLKKYLESLVMFVNANPAILNGKTLDGKPEPMEINANSYLGRTGLKLLPHIKMGEAASDSRNSLLKLGEYANMARMLKPSVPFGFPITSFGGGLQTGGGSSGGAALKPIINGLISDLSRHGKKLRPADQEQIDKMIATLDQLDTSLGKIAQQLIEYKGWIEQNPGKTSETISMGTIERSIDKYRECVAKYHSIESGLINVASKLCTV